MGRILIGNIKGPQGEAGKNFEYAKTYASVSAMNADFSGTDVDEGEYVVISAGIDDADNGRVYRKGTNSYVYVNRVNGPTGPRGATGPMPTLVNNLNTTTAGQGALDAAQGPTIAGKVTGNGGEAGDTIATFATSDTTTDSEIIKYTAMEKLTSGSPLKTLMSIMSKAVKNVRWFQKLLGTTDISGIGNGTVTNAVSTLNDAKADKTTVNEIDGRFITYIYNDTRSGIATKEIIRIWLAMVHNEGLVDFTTKRTYPVFFEMTGPSATTMVGYVGVSPTAMRFLLSAGAGSDVYHGVFMISSHQITYLYRISSSVVS